MTQPESYQQKQQRQRAVTLALVAEALSNLDELREAFDDLDTFDRVKHPELTNEQWADKRYTLLDIIANTARGLV